MMKLPFITSIFAIALAWPLAGQEPANPFVKQNETNEPAPPVGSSFVSLLEHMLVPPALLDEWLLAHPLGDDATELRAAVQGWITEGKAKLDHIALNLGTEGRKTSSGSVLEQIYPTEFSPGGEGAWPYPTSFETRNLGCSGDSGISDTKGQHHLWAELEYGELVTSRSWHPLVEQTRQPGDVFIPTIRTARLVQDPPNSETGNGDPFAETTYRGVSSSERIQGMELPPGPARLAARVDPVTNGTAGDTLSRLIFFRGAISETPGKGTVADMADLSHFSFRTLRVSHSEFSSWILTRDLVAATAEAWEACLGWARDGKAESLGELTTTLRRGTRSTLENIVEVIYPTEWEPANEWTVTTRWEEGKKVAEKEGVAHLEKRKVLAIPGLGGASQGTSFETRNTGSTGQAYLSADESGLLLQFNMERVTQVGESVHRRILVNDQWIPDITMPLFSSSKIEATVRLQPGKWTLVGVGSEYLPSGKVDGDHCLLNFVKAE